MNTWWVTSNGCGGWSDGGGIWLLPMMVVLGFHGFWWLKTDREGSDLKTSVVCAWVCVSLLWVFLCGSWCKCVWVGSVMSSNCNNLCLNYIKGFMLTAFLFLSCCLNQICHFHSYYVRQLPPITRVLCFHLCVMVVLYKLVTISEKSKIPEETWYCRTYPLTGILTHTQI